MIIIISLFMMCIMIMSIVYIAFLYISQSKNKDIIFIHKINRFKPIISGKTEMMPIVKQIIQQSGELLNKMAPLPSSSIPTLYTTTPVSTTTPTPSIPAPMPSTPISTTISTPSTSAPAPSIPTPSIPMVPSLPDKDLYDFTTHTFTNAGATGRYGPTLEQIRTAYSSTPLAKDYINMNNNNGIQLWTVPKTGNYLIRAVGSSANIGTYGNGRDIQATFPLKKGDIIKILVGQQGTHDSSVYEIYKGVVGRVAFKRSKTYNNSNITGGGGGTFVSTNDDEALIVAGGGGGHGPVPDIADAEKANASNTTFGKQPFSNYLASAIGGGEGSEGAGGGEGTDYGAGGGGFYKNGSNAKEQAGGINSIGGKAFVNGGMGGNGGNINTNGDSTTHGGFGGGGGSGHGWSHYGGGNGGGGGGYSGGGGGGVIWNWDGSVIAGYGGGGGSFSSTTMTDNGLNVANHGRVTITFQK